MSDHSRFLAGLAAVGVWCSGGGGELLLAQDSLKGLKFRRDVALSEFEGPVKSLNEKYEVELDALKKRAQESGDLDQALAIETERASYQGAASATFSAFAGLARLQEIFQRERLRLFNERYEAQQTLMALFSENLEAQEKQLTVAGKLEEAVAVRQEKVDSEHLLAEMKRRRALAEGVLFEETFEGTLDPELWFKTEDIHIEEGAAVVRSYDSGTRMELKRPIDGDFEVAIEFNRDGEEVWVNWDCAVKLTAAAPVAAFRLARDDINLVYLDPSPNSDGRPRAPGEPGILKETQRGRKTQQAILVITVQNGEMVASIIDSKGEKGAIAGPAKIATSQETGIVIRFGGTPETPRKIQGITIKRL